MVILFSLLAKQQSSHQTACKMDSSACKYRLPFYLLQWLVLVYMSYHIHFITAHFTFHSVLSGPGENTDTLLDSLSVSVMLIKIKYSTMIMRAETTSVVTAMTMILLMVTVRIMTIKTATTTTKTTTTRTTTTWMYWLYQHYRLHTCKSLQAGISWGLGWNMMYFI